MKFLSFLFLIYIYSKLFRKNYETVYLILNNNFTLQIICKVFCSKKNFKFKIFNITIIYIENYFLKSQKSYNKINYNIIINNLILNK